MSRSKDIIFLFGAGTSAEADIPVSGEMINKVEKLLISESAWKPHYDLYNHVKSSIHFAAGLKGRFNNEVQFNIETLVNTLYELERNEEHPLYPFIASWNSRFVALAKPDFSNVKQFRRLILEALKKWMCPENTAKANYYQGLLTLQRDLNFPLHVFSLNYDLCIERLNSPDFRVETGFPDFGPDHYWSWERFETIDSEEISPEILLYKLHGSINWKRDQATKNLFRVEQIQSVDAEQMEIIFGRDFKLEAADPYLFFAYEFRRFSLMTKLVVIVGYGFGDQHINKMLTQCVRGNTERCLLVVQKCAEEKIQQKAEEIAIRLELDGDQKKQIFVHSGSAKDFLEAPGLADLLKGKIPESIDMPF
jgi:hypothetical protein